VELPKFAHSFSVNRFSGGLRFSGGVKYSRQAFSEVKV